MGIVLLRAVLGTCGALCLVSVASAEEFVTRYITPKRVVWTSDSSSVRDSRVLLRAFDGQVAVNAGECCTLSTAEGGRAAILLDFGKEYQGGIELCAAIRPDKRPLRVRVRYGESVAEAMSDEGSSATNDHAVRDFIQPVPWLGSVRTGESGFRFVRIDLIEPQAELNLKAVRLVARYRDIPWLGSFESDVPRLNEIWSTGAYTVHLNMQNYLWDGIKRDRLVWVGDLHPEILCVNSVFGRQELVGRSLDFARDDTPLPGWMNGMCSYSLWWIICQRDLYMYTGDAEYLAAQHVYLSALVDQVLDHISGNRENFTGGTRFLDWPTSEMPEVVHAGLQALAVMSLRAASELAGWLADEALRIRCDEAVGRLTAYLPDHRGNKQAAALLALAGMLPADRAAGIILEGGANGFSTFYGYYMLEALALAGEYEAAIGIISDYWGVMLDLGATTFWEELDYAEVARAGRIDELMAEGKYDLHGGGGAWCYAGYRRSLCHGWASGPTSWFTRHVLGVVPLKPGFRKVAITPSLGSIVRVRGTVPTPFGTISVSHEKQPDGKVHTVYQAPPEIEVVVTP